MNAAPARTAVFATCAAAHAALIAAFWSTTPLRAADRPRPALVYALPAPGMAAVPEGRISTARVPRAVQASAPAPAAPAFHRGSVPTEAPSEGGLALGDAAIAHALPASAVAPPDESSPHEGAEPAGTPVAPAAADIEASIPAAPPPPAARALPPAPRRVDLQLAYHRMRAAQDALRFHHAQGEHLAWLQGRVTALLAAAAAPDAMVEGAHCTARVADARLSVQCDDPGLGERLAREDGDLAVFLTRLIALTAPGGAVEIAFLPAQPPVVAGL